MTDQYKNSGTVRTELYCHACDKDFLANINFDIDGQHILKCPHCGHQHCRVIEGGFVTGDRWDSRNDVVDEPPTEKGSWKGDNGMRTNTVSSFLRDAWVR